MTTATPLREHLQTMARYHAWATARLLAALQPLDDGAWRRDCGLFFRSVHGTLNHLLVVEQLVWRRRFDEGASPVVALDTELEPDRGRLAARVQALADGWRSALDGWGDERLAGRLDYLNMRGQPASLPFAATLAHVFNHGTHHRGQLTATLTRLGQPGPELDLVYMLQAEAATPARKESR
jgi:uncharacterized damage-inducible protein DinB